MPERMLRSAEVQKRVALGRTTIWRMEGEGNFPARRQVGSGTVCWLESEIDEWIRTRPVVNMNGAPHTATP